MMAEHHLHHSVDQQLVTWPVASYIAREIFVAL